MEWPKVKNIIILILLLVNGFLLLLVGGQQYRVQLYNRSATTRAAEVLAQNGIEVSQEALKQAADGSLSPALSASRDLTAEAAFAQVLLGADAACTNQGGGVYTYSSPMGSASFRSGGDFRIDLSGYPASGDHASHAASVLDQLGLNGEAVSSPTLDSDTVTFRQLLNGVPLYSCQISFEYSGDQLARVHGTALIASVSPSPGDSAGSLDLPTALIRFLEGILDSGDVCSSVTGLRPGYRSAQTFGGVVQLTPVWLVSTNISDYYLDGVTGELNRVF